MSSDNWFKVIKGLLSKGRAFKLPFNNPSYKFHKAQSKEPDRVCEYYTAVRNSGIPSIDMDIDSLNDWESDLGIPINSSLTNDQRIERIIAKYYSVGGQGPGYIQDRFQSAGFDVYVYENNPEVGARQYTTVLGDFQSGDAQLGDFTDRIDPRSLSGYLLANPPIYINRKDYLGSQLGDTGSQMGSFQLGEFSKTLIEEFKYIISSDSSKYIFFWFLAGPGGIYDIVNIPADRQADFESLVYQIKPAHTWVIAQVNYV
jgi:uncharacterized protein YmfQ (DUF2313 family)